MRSEIWWSPCLYLMLMKDTNINFNTYTFTFILYTTCYSFAVYSIRIVVYVLTLFLVVIPLCFVLQLPVQIDVKESSPFNKIRLIDCYCLIAGHLAAFWRFIYSLNALEYMSGIHEIWRRNIKKNLHCQEIF